ncbi:MAG: hypothetical protein H6760_04100 [Candidatus Nomurabacteria bacterium]|nr:MAG: hypothetical protein H6760_04100 [Candidatus Nomurabacteria bacterium]
MRVRFGKEERFLVITLLVIAAYIWLVTGVPAVRDGLNRFWDWLISLSATQGYIGGFLISFLANFSIVVPIPYTVVIVLIAAADINPLLLGIIAGVGAGLGEGSSYFLGYFGQKLTNDVYKKNLDVLKRLIEHKRWYVYIVLFLIGATPIPDDIFIVPLGFLRYGFIRMLIPVALGKMVITIGLAAFGKYTNIASAVAGSNQSNLVSNVLTLVLSVLAVYLMLKVNWDKLGDRLVGKKQNSPAK